MATVHVTADTFKKEVEEEKDKLVIIDFWAPWCGPCKMLGPVFEELSTEFKDIKFVKVNIDEEQDLASSFGVQSIPTLSFVKNAKELDRVMGAMPKPKLKEVIEQIA